MKQRFGWILLAAVFLLQAGGTPPVTAQETEALGDDYVAGDFGRLLYQENGVTVRRASTETEPSLERVAGLNAPIFPGDGVVTSFDQRAEIQLASGSLVRIDRASDLTFLALPDPYAEIADNTVLQMQQGVVRINAVLTNDSQFRIDTPAATAFLLDDADFRIAVDEDGATYIASHRGVVEVTVGDRSVLLRSGTKTTIYPGGSPEDPVSFNTLRGDSFDRWVSRRDAELRDSDRYAGSIESYDELPNEVRPYHRELSRHGRWVHADEYGWVWYPSNVGSDWSPYYDGYWSYGSRGYFWVSHESWGWAPYHYGRWGYYGGAWCWIPGRVFGGAWVAWSWGSAYVGWSPLGYWNTAYCGSPWAYRYGYYGPSWSFVSYNNFHHHSYRRHVLRYDRIGRDYLTDSAVVTRPPRVRPRDLARSTDARQRAHRLADADRVAHLRPVDRETRGTGNNLRGAERRLVAERGARVAAMRDRTGSGRIESVSNGPGRGRPVAADRDSNGDRGRNGNGNANPSAVRTNSNGLTTRTGASGGVVRRGESGRSGTNGRTVTERKAARPSDARGNPRATPRAEGSTTPRERMRDVYENMSGPRSTRERRGEATTRPSSRTRSGNQPKASSTPNSGGSRPKATSGRTSGASRPKASPGRNNGGSQPKASPRSNSGSRPKASPPSRSSGGSRPKASPGRSSGGSRPKASPGRSSGGSRPKASPGRSSGGSRPKASPGRSSGGSRPKASPGRSSGGSRPKASPGRSSGGSRPKASPSRSSGGSRPKASPSRRSGGSRPKASPSRSSGGSRSKASSSRAKKKD